MPTTIREQVLSAFFARLAVADVTTVARMRFSEFRRAELPAINMIDGGEDPQNAGFSGQRDVALTITVEVVATTTRDTDNLGAELNAVFGLAHAAVTGDHTLGGVAQSVELASIDDPEIFDIEGGDDAAAMACRYEIRFAHLEGDPFNLP